VPALELRIANETHSISTGELSRLARFNTGTLSLLADGLGAILNSRLADLSTGMFEVDLSAERELSWSRDFAGAGSLNFSFTPAVGGKLILRKSGEVFQYTEAASEDGAGSVEAVQVPAGKAYVSLLFRVSLQASGAGEYSHGLFGVRAGISTENTFLAGCHVCVDETETVRNGIVAAFERFVFPLDEAAPQKLALHDYMEYEFFGKLSFAIGATTGFHGVFFGGLTAGALAKTVSSELGSLTARINPSWALGASLDVAWEHEDAYRIVLGVPDESHLHLFLFKMDTSRLTTTLKLSAKVKVNAAVELQPRVDQILQNAAERTFANVPDAVTRNGLVQRLLDRIRSNPEAVQEFVNQAQERANGYLQRLERLSVEATVTHERISEKTALFSYRFVRPLTGKGFALAMAGDFAGALAQEGVELGVGSFVRRSLVKRTSIGIEFFEAFRATSITEYFKKSELVYAGQGIFRFRFTAGMKASSDVFGRKKAVEMYFRASAAAVDAGAVSEKDVVFCIETEESRNPAAASQTAGVIELLIPGSAVAPRLRELLDANPDLAVHLACTFPLAALRRLPFTPFGANGKPMPLPHAQDAANYRAFVEAVDLLFDLGGFQGQGFPNAVDRFGAWAHYNITAIDLEGASRPPDRRQRGNANVASVWPQSPSFPAAGLDPPLRFMVRAYLVGAQQFMNLCEDLVLLSKAVEDPTTLKDFENVLEAMADLIQKDQGGHPLHFTKPVLVALSRRMGAVVGEVVAPPADAVVDRFEVELKFA